VSFTSPLFARAGAFAAGTRLDLLQEIIANIPSPNRTKFSPCGRLSVGGGFLRAISRVMSAIIGRDSTKRRNIGNAPERVRSARGGPAENLVRAMLPAGPMGVESRP